MMRNIIPMRIFMKVHLASLCIYFYNSFFIILIIASRIFNILHILFSYPIHSSLLHYHSHLMLDIKAMLFLLLLNALKRLCDTTFIALSILWMFLKNEM